MSSLYERAAIIPGRSMTRSKAPGRMFDVGAGPLYALSAHGSQIVGDDGKTYIDMLCALGAISLGYGRHPLRAVNGVLSLPHRAEIAAAEAVLASVAPWASSVRFVKTGSEATHAAYRIAKAATGRSRVLVGDWAYHGWHEWIGESETFRNGDALFTDAIPVAAVFIEPHRWEPVNVEWLQHVRSFCDRVGALMVFDSMIYGGRFALGGASEYFGIVPDLECYGKAFGNGASVAFVVGNEALAEHGELVSGTYSGDVTGLNAVIDTLKIYAQEDVIATLWARGRQLADGLEDVSSRYPSMKVVLEGAVVHQRFRFPDSSTGKRFAGEMAKRGVLWHPDVVNIMAAHTEEQIAQVIEAADKSCRALEASL